MLKTVKLEIECQKCNQTFDHYCKNPSLALKKKKYCTRCLWKMAYEKRMAKNGTHDADR